MKKDIYIFPKDDIKAKLWSNYSNKKIILNSNSYIKYFLLIIKSSLSYKDVIVFYRYLNVKKNLFREFTKFFIDIIIL